MDGGRRGLIAAGVTTAAAGLSWALMQRSDRSAIAADPMTARLRALPAGRRGTVTSFDGTALNVEQFGPETGDPLVLIHGWTCSLRFWSLQIQALSEEVRVVAVDLRGHGRSARATAGDYSIEAFGRDVDAVLDSCLDEGERATLAGHSLGAMSVVAHAGEVAEWQRERVKAAALINTGLGDLVSESLVVASPQALDRFKRSAGELVLKARAPIPGYSTPLSHRIVHHVALGPDASPGEIAFTEQLVIECPADVRAACGGTLGRLDLHRAVRSLSVPTLVIAGERDRLTPVRHAEDLVEELPDPLALQVIPRSGHMSPIEDGDVVNDALRELHRRR